MLGFIAVGMEHETAHMQKQPWVTNYGETMVRYDHPKQSSALRSCTKHQFRGGFGMEEKTGNRLVSCFEARLFAVGRRSAGTSRSYRFSNLILFWPDLLRAARLRSRFSPPFLLTLLLSLVPGGVRLFGGWGSSNSSSSKQQQSSSNASIDNSAF